MKRVEEYFLEKAKNLSFIELKKGSQVEIKGHRVEAELPLPIITEVLLEEIRQGGAEDEISLLNMINGIIYLFGTDGDFIHNKSYEDLLLSFDPKIEEFILYNGLEYMKKEDFVRAAIYLRAIIYLERVEEVSLFNYAMALENIAQGLENDKLVEELVLEATRSLEAILDINERFSLAYYKLGYHYKYSEQFLKAKLIWEKYLELEDDIERQNEVREELVIIDRDVEFEEAIILLTQGQYNVALEKLLQIGKTSNWWNIDYLIGLCYKNLEETEKAIDYMEEAITKGGEEAIVYNELAISYFSMGDGGQAIEKFSQGIGLDPSNYEIVFNRGLVYQHMGLVDQAIQDLEKAYELNPENFIKEHLEAVRGF